MRNLKARIDQLEALPGAAGYTGAEDAPDSVLIRAVVDSLRDEPLSDLERRVCAKLLQNRSEDLLTTEEVAAWDGILQKIIESPQAA